MSNLQRIAVVVIGGALGVAIGHYAPAHVTMALALAMFALSVMIDRWRR